ncbi:hypothetical protein GCM10010423_29690 [Streptomyces levis]|uniref:Uncharacterized protein n=1 Tax=Streptomyces levis TaxID=285566 RepID=A0ABN3NT51_9ACTN
MVGRAFPPYAATVTRAVLAIQPEARTTGAVRVSRQDLVRVLDAVQPAGDVDERDAWRAAECSRRLS